MFVANTSLRSAANTALPGQHRNDGMRPISAVLDSWWQQHEHKGASHSGELPVERLPSGTRHAAPAFQ